MIDVECACGETYHADASHVGKAIRCHRCGRILTIHGRVPEAAHVASPIPQASHGTDRPGPSARHGQRYTPAAPARRTVSPVRSATVLIGLVLVFAIWVASIIGPGPGRPAATDTEAWGRLPSDLVLPTGQDLWPAEWRGFGVLIVENGTEFDGVIRLVNRQTMLTERAVFIQAGDKATVTGIGRGTFILKYGLGWGLTEQGTFDRYGHYGQFERELVFSETRQQATVYEVTLHKVASGDARTRDISEEDFVQSDLVRPPVQEAQRTPSGRSGPLAAVDARAAAIHTEWQRAGGS